LCFLLQSLIPPCWAVLLAQVTWGAFWTFTSGALAAWLSDEAGENRANAGFLAGSQFDQAGAMFGTLYTTWVNQHLDSRVRATVLSMSSRMDAVGQMTGGPLLGIIGSVISIQAVLISSSLSLSPVIGLRDRGSEQETQIREQRD
jgi:hypothetical protein